LSDSLYTFAWAPTGSKLAYIDATGAVVVDVPAGVAGTPQRVMSAPAPPPASGIAAYDMFVWSPDGAHLAYARTGNVFIFDLTGAQPINRTVTAPTIGAPSVGQMVFNQDGSLLAFVADETRAGFDVFTVRTASTSMAVNAHPGLADGESVSSPTWQG